MSLRLVLATSLLVLAFTVAGMGQTVYKWTNIDEQTGWQSCSACAGGKNSSNNYSGPINVSSPSLDGKSAQFAIKYPWPSYANVLWWKNELAGGGDHAKIASLYNFTYDLYYYIKQPRNSQALEFDVSQTICDGDCTSGTSKRYTFGTECNRKTTGTWRLWDASQGWVSTGIPCSIPQYSWVHLVYEFQRTSTNQLKYISLTINGTKYYLNKTANPLALSVQADDFNADFQMDGDFRGHPYTTWLDKITLTAW